MRSVLKPESVQKSRPVSLSPNDAFIQGQKVFSSQSMKKRGHTLTLALRQGSSESSLYDIYFMVVLENMLALPRKLATI